jgi:hypothetical protein
MLITHPPGGLPVQVAKIVQRKIPHQDVEQIGAIGQGFRLCCKNEGVMINSSLFEVDQRSVSS